MTTPKIYTMVILAILTFSSQVTKAEIANGSYSFDSNGTAALWDISGDYSNDDGNGLNMDFSVSEDSSGNLKGTGTFAYDDGDNYLDGNITLTGYVKGSATAKLVSMVISMSGSGTFVVDEDGDTHDVTFTAKDSTNFSVDSANSQLVITSGSLSVTVKDLTTRKTAHQTVKAGKGESMSLPDTSTGDWSLALNLTPTKTKYAGTATVTTSTGKTVSLTATGSYNSKKDTSTIILKGANNSLSLVISTSGSTMHIQSATGKLLGQNINIKAK